jgi:hypothetical protein
MKRSLSQTKNSIKSIFRSPTEDGDYREEAESMLPKVKSWREAGDTPHRKNHREKAKL